MQSLKILKDIRKEIENTELGYSIVELLVVVSVFSLIALIATQSIVLTLRGTKKSESLISVRENVDYAFSVIERRIRNAQEIDGSCNLNSRTLDFIDEFGRDDSFSCQGGANGFLASGSARLTSDNVRVNCDDSHLPIFKCNFPAGGTPSVEIKVTASDASSEGEEGAEFTTSTTILIRSY